MSVMLLILKTKPGRKILVYLPSFLILIQLVGLISLMLTAPKEVYIVDYTKYDYSGEFDVAPGKNTIILVFDAVDNTYIKSLYNDNSELFEDFNDFTLYTNTCSVYDHTHFSLPQMMTGCGFNGEELADYNEFYERLHNNGYEVDYYFYEMDRTLPDIRNYIDNCSIEEPAKDMLEVDYQDIFLQSAAMSWYQTMPYAAKMFVNAEELSFNKQLIIKGAESEGIYGNEEFLSALDLNINDRTDNRLTMIHLNGAHYNWDESNEYMSMTVTCLDIAAEYIRQLKKLGLYDDATIILTADHGLHETLHNVCEPATPMLMIKNAGAHGEAMAVTDAPVYHTDFPKTILIGAGLYNETADGDRFGFSFYDFEESDERVRTWYDYDEGNFYAFTYSGDTSDLENCVNNMDCEVIPYE